MTRGVSAIGWAAGIALVLLAVLMGHPLLEGHRFPLGPDGPVYIWWTAFADAAGLDAVRRPGFPGLALVMRTVLPADPTAVVFALEPALAVVTGLAGAAFVTSALGADRLRTSLAAGLVTAFAAFLAPGWLANLALAALFLAALAAFSLADRSWRPVVLGAGCIGAAGITHALFLLVSLAVLFGALALQGPGVLRQLREGAPFWSVGAVRVAAGAGSGAGVALLGLAAFAGGASAPGDASQDQFFRRAGLRRLMQERFAGRLANDARRVAAAAGAGAALGAMLPVVRRPRGPGWRFLAAVVLSWALITAAGLILLWRTNLAPGARLLTFAFFLPVLGAPVAAAALRRRGWRGGVAAVAVAAMLLGGMAAWYRQSPFMSEEEIGAVADAATVAEGLPPGTPLIFVVDTKEFAAAFHVTRFANVIRSGLPGERIADARVVVGSPEDLRLRRVGTVNEDPEYRAISRAYLRAAVPLLDRAAVFVLRPFNTTGFGEALREGTTISPEAILLSTPHPAADEAVPLALRERPGTSPWTVAGLAAAALVMLALLGGGWARWGLPGASPEAVAALAPAAGMAVAIAGALAADRLALPAAASGAILAALLGLSGYLVAVRTRHQPVQGSEGG